jgi:deoxycytidylate deaminase
MASAFLSSFRSHDSESKVGAVLVKDRVEIARGYNGFPCGVDEEGLDRTRPKKYKYMIHAEANMLANMVIKPESAVLYCTRMPCLNCSNLLWQNNIKKWYVPIGCSIDGKTKTYSHEEEEVLSLLLKSGLEIEYVNFNASDLVTLSSENQKYFSYLD